MNASGDKPVILLVEGEEGGGGSVEKGGLLHGGGPLPDVGASGSESVDLWTALKNMSVSVQWARVVLEPLSSSTSGVESNCGFEQAVTVPTAWAAGVLETKCPELGSAGFGSVPQTLLMSPGVVPEKRFVRSSSPNEKIFRVTLVAGGVALGLLGVFSVVLLVRRVVQHFAPMSSGELEASGLADEVELGDLAGAATASESSESGE